MYDYTNDLATNIESVIDKYSNRNVFDKKRSLGIIQALQQVANKHQKDIDNNEKVYKLFVQTLFFLASIGGFTAAIIEVLHAKEIEEKNETQNWITPLCLIFVRLLMIPYFWRLYKISHVGKSPLFSSSPDLNIWTKIITGILWFVAFGYAARLWH